MVLWIETLSLINKNYKIARKWRPQKPRELKEEKSKKVLGEGREDGEAMVKGKQNMDFYQFEMFFVQTKFISGFIEEVDPTLVRSHPRQTIFYLLRRRKSEDLELLSIIYSDR